MSNRERKRAARHRRKQRSGARRPEAGPHSAASGNGASREDAVVVEDIAAEAEQHGISRSELKDRAARERLEPLAAGERPRVVTIGAVISALIAAVTVGAWLAGAEVNGERPNVVQTFAPSILFAVMAYGMWRARYWAVLGFQAVMAILMVGGFLTLISATTLASALTPALVIAGAGALFWFTVKALARIQMPSRPEGP
jgi:hypothetical protein